MSIEWGLYFHSAHIPSGHSAPGTRVSPMNKKWVMYIWSDAQAVGELDSAVHVIEVLPILALAHLNWPHASATWKCSGVNVPKGPHSINRDGVLPMPAGVMFLRYVLHSFLERFREDWDPVAHRSPLVLNTPLIVVLPFLISPFLIWASWNRLPDKLPAPKFFFHHFFWGEISENQEFQYSDMGCNRSMNSRRQ